MSPAASSRFSASNFSSSQSPSSHVPEQPSQSLQRHKIRLFRHLSSILCQLSEQIMWDELEPGERRRLERVVAGLCSELHAAQRVLRPDRAKTRSRKLLPHLTTKAAFRKR